MNRATLHISICVLIGLIGTDSAVNLFAQAQDQRRPGMVRCANLIYGNNQSALCFSDQFLKDVQKETNIWTEQKFTQIQLESDRLYQFPFAVMSGEGSFQFTDEQAQNLKRYLTGGGFLLASAGCSSKLFHESFMQQIDQLFPENKLIELSTDHSVFHLVYEIDSLETKKRGVEGVLYALEMNGRVAMVYSPQGLNDTAHAGGDCCCCGSNEVINARQINVNLLAYALTH